MPYAGVLPGDEIHCKKSVSDDETHTYIFDFELLTLN